MFVCYFKKTEEINTMFGSHSLGPNPLPPRASGSRFLPGVQCQVIPVQLEKKAQEGGVVRQRAETGFTCAKLVLTAMSVLEVGHEDK